MEEEEKRALVEAQGFTLDDGSFCHVAGWMQSYASVTSHKPGFWGISWERLAEIAKADHVIPEKELRLTSSRWLGYNLRTGDTDA